MDACYIHQHISTQTVRSRLHFRAWRTCFMMMCVAISPGCLPDFEQVHGEHILYEHSASLHPCAGTASYLDRAASLFGEYLHIPKRPLLRYSWLSEADVPWDLSESGGEFGRVGMTIGNHAWGE